MKRIYLSTLVSVVTGVAALGLIAGCASSSGPTQAAAAAASSGAGSGFSAYAACLSQHGVTLPSRGSFHRSPGAGGFTARPSGGFGGGGFGGGFASADPTMAAAMQACAADRPTGGFGGGFGAGGSRLTAFRNCMGQQGEPLPSARPTAFATGQGRYLGGLSTADPKVAEALAVCKPLLPTGAPGSAPSSAPTSG